MLGGRKPLNVTPPGAGFSIFHKHGGILHSWSSFAITGVMRSTTGTRGKAHNPATRFAIMHYSVKYFAVNTPINSWSRFWLLVFGKSRAALNIGHERCGKRRSEPIKEALFPGGDNASVWQSVARLLCPKEHLHVAQVGSALVEQERLRPCAARDEPKCSCATRAGAVG